jgi:transposase-like protein
MQPNTSDFASSRVGYLSLWAAIKSIAPRIGCVPQTLNEWVKRNQIDTGVRDGITTSEREQMGHGSEGKTKPTAHPQNAGRICQAIALSARSSLPDKTSSNVARLLMTSATNSRGKSGLPASSWVPAFMTCQWRFSNIAAKPSDNFAFLGCVKVSALIAFFSCVA